MDNSLNTANISNAEFDFDNTKNVRSELGKALRVGNILNIMSTVKNVSLNVAITKITPKRIFTKILSKN